MVDHCDLIVGYRTNPHVDYIERGEEAALALRLMLAGLADPKSAFIRLPLTPASVSLLTAAGPYGDMIDYGNRRRAELAGDILNVSIFGGFVFSDSSKNGVAIVVTARHDVARARMLAREIAERGWADRPRWKKKLTPLSEAIEMACNRKPQTGHLLRLWRQPRRRWHRPHHRASLRTRLVRGGECADRLLFRPAPRRHRPQGRRRQRRSRPSSIRFRASLATPPSKPRLRSSACTMERSSAASAMPRAAP